MAKKLFWVSALADFSLIFRDLRHHTFDTCHFLSFVAATRGLPDFHTFLRASVETEVKQ
jgi:hypothetical protein